MTLGELGRRMSSAEFTGWMAYAELEPFGPLREDARAGVIAATAVNIATAGAKERRHFGPGDFFDSLREPEPVVPVTAEQRVAKLRAWAARMNKRPEARKVPRL